MITLRLDPKLEKTINSAAHQLGVSRSELIRKSITAFIDTLDKPTPWELGSEVFGKHASEQESLSRDRKRLLKNKIKTKTKTKR